MSREALCHDGEPDVRVRRSLPAYSGFMRGQPVRVRRGLAGLAGNCVAIAVADGGPCVPIAHLRRGTVAVREGQRVDAGQPIGECGNSGNTTQPHVHLQVSDSLSGADARGLPFVFAAYRTSTGVVRGGVPAEAEIVERVS
ncbi:MAG: M23 family metallopeptidase [Micropruina sp.]|uniref:M23 family metallopeptidase n=1 Tax=Micropruina sp. TaxID=2737536 RepID=UPI0039E66280